MPAKVESVQDRKSFPPILRIVDVAATIGFRVIAPVAAFLALIMFGFLHDSPEGPKGDLKILLYALCALIIVYGIVFALTFVRLERIENLWNTGGTKYRCQAIALRLPIYVLFVTNVSGFLLLQGVEGCRTRALTASPANKEPREGTGLAVRSEQATETSTPASSEETYAMRDRGPRLKVWGLREVREPPEGLPMAATSGQHARQDISSSTAVGSPPSWEAAMGALPEGLFSRDSQLRQEAIQDFAAAGPSTLTQTPNLLAIAASAPSPYAGHAFEVLAAIGDPEAVKPLLNLAKRWKDEKAIFENVVKTIDAIHPAWRKTSSYEDIFNDLSHVLTNDTKSKQRELSARMLGFTMDQRATPLLIRALEEDSDNLVRSAAASSLGMLKSPEAVRPLLDVLRLKVGNESLVMSAGFSLGKIGDPTIVDELVEIINDETMYGRSAAVDALGNIAPVDGYDHIVYAVETGIKERHMGLLMEGTQALCWTGNLMGTETLLKAWRAYDPQPSWLDIPGCLRRLTGEDLGSDRQAWEDWWAAHSLNRAEQD